MSAKQESFDAVTWDPLKVNEDFRLLHLDGHSTGELLTATLTNVSFEEASDQYIAISYAWGEDSQLEAITCNGRTVYITETLHSALRRVRQPEEAISVWCDALCIQQGSDDASLLERSRQIPLIGRIYGSAVRVIIDLGDDDGTLDQALEAIDAILLTPQDLRARCHFEANPQEYLKLPPFTDPMWDVLQTFLSRRWFQRIWCVQETVLARDAIVMFGPHAMSIEQLVIVAAIYSIVCSVAVRTFPTRTWATLKFNTPIFAMNCLTSTWQRRKARLASTAGDEVSLCQLMMSTMIQQSSDQRDRVYALYGMLGPQLAEELPASYSESIAELGIRLSKYLVRHKNSVWMLVHCGGINPSQPSWTIDLNLLGIRYKLDPLRQLTQHDGTNTLYAAGGHPPDAARISLHSLSGCLTVRGVIADIVQYTPMPLDPTVHSILDSEKPQRITPVTISKIIKWINEATQWAQQFADEDAYWRTLILNYNQHFDDAEREDSGRAKAGFKAYFDSLVAYARKTSSAGLNFDDMTADEFQTICPIPAAGAVKYWLALISPLWKRRLIRTRSGRFGLVPIDCQVNDVIAVFHGVPVPFILRPDSNDADKAYNVVGISYVHGLMNGEALQQNLPVSDILLK